MIFPHIFLTLIDSSIFPGLQDSCMQTLDTTELAKDFYRELSKTIRTSSSIFCQPSVMFN